MTALVTMKNIFVGFVSGNYQVILPIMVIIYCWLNKRNISEWCTLSGKKTKITKILFLCCGIVTLFFLAGSLTYLGQAALTWLEKITGKSGQGSDPSAKLLFTLYSLFLAVLTGIIFKVVQDKIDSLKTYQKLFMREIEKGTEAYEEVKKAQNQIKLLIAEQNNYRIQETPLKLEMMLLLIHNIYKIYKKKDSQIIEKQLDRLKVLIHADKIINRTFFSRKRSRLFALQNINKILVTRNKKDILKSLTSPSVIQWVEFLQDNDESEKVRDKARQVYRNIHIAKGRLEAD